MGGSANCSQLQQELGKLRANPPKKCTDAKLAHQEILQSEKSFLEACRRLEQVKGKSLEATASATRDAQPFLSPPALEKAIDRFQGTTQDKIPAPEAKACEEELNPLLQFRMRAMRLLNDIRNDR
jgi:hypothetical protein